jgi:hypothetical protein
LNVSKCSLNVSKCSLNVSKCSLNVSKCSLNVSMCLKKSQAAVDQGPLVHSRHGGLD